MVAAFPPVHVGAPTMTRNEPSELGLKLTCTLVELTTDAVTLSPPAVIAAREPKVLFDGSCSLLSTQVSASVPMAPDVAAAAPEREVVVREAHHRVLASSAMVLTRRMAVAISSANCRRRSAISG